MVFLFSFPSLLINHCRGSKNSNFQTRLSANPFFVKMIFFVTRIHNHFHINDFALSLKYLIMLCLFLRTIVVFKPHDRLGVKSKKNIPKTAEMQLMSSIKKTLNLLDLHLELLWCCQQLKKQFRHLVPRHSGNTGL